MPDTGLYDRYNYDDVFNRCVIVGLLNLMNEEMKYEQIWDNNTVETVSIPVVYDFGSSEERFAQDYYTFFGTDCIKGKKIDGKFDMFPRGAVRYSGSAIEASAITNRFVRGTYLKNENGRLVTYTSYLYSMPVTFNFDCEFWADNIITAFKIEEAIRATFYKNKTYNVLYRGMKLGCRAGFPEQSSIEKTTEYSFQSNNNGIIKITFSLAVEAYQPVFDHTQDIPAEHYIKDVAYDIKIGGVKESDVIQSINIHKDSFDTSVVYPQGTNVMIEWDTYSNISDMCTLALTYVKDDGEECIMDDHIIYNQKSYRWHIPAGFTNYVQPEITFFSDEYVEVIQTPHVKIVPDLKTGDINEKSFIVIDPGRFIVKSSDSNLVRTAIDYVKTDGSLAVSESYSFRIRNGQLDMSNPVCITGSHMIYENDLEPARISFKLSYPLNPSISDQIDNILVL